MSAHVCAAEREQCCLFCVRGKHEGLEAQPQAESGLNDHLVTREKYIVPNWFVSELF